MIWVSGSITQMKVSDINDVVEPAEADDELKCTLYQATLTSRVFKIEAGKVRSTKIRRDRGSGIILNHHFESTQWVSRGFSVYTVLTVEEVVVSVKSVVVGAGVKSVVVGSGVKSVVVGSGTGEKVRAVGSGEESVVVGSGTGEKVESVDTAPDASVGCEVDALDAGSTAAPPLPKVVEVVASAGAEASVAEKVMGGTTSVTELPLPGTVSVLDKLFGTPPIPAPPFPLEVVVGIDGATVVLRPPSTGEDAVMTAMEELRYLVDI
ncbi:protein of unknown function [Taphrina deformans PYCC 5710]|uniref:Uncharacterized protein n=1 Tax=Taphrina deformans (strain PYCC 5710 / ATCC 11124 / CBS 356.35 / IMI 108563 / JCM 9778 / NBRC 8474) TaxID=1097556 RepID=R4XFW7_TAPDE|nr:protein of unknown function [Taphrina deformans PYCC 5710]|eukprot:CCG84630.1 protein of unknown function [Taphrina deformans PYCC 5710]